MSEKNPEIDEKFKQLARPGETIPWQVSLVSSRKLTPEEIQYGMELEEKEKEVYDQSAEETEKEEL